MKQLAHRLTLMAIQFISETGLWDRIPGLGNADRIKLFVILSQLIYMIDDISIVDPYPIFLLLT